MKIVIFALGSRGDVQPYIALGKGLKDAGHVVRIVSHENFEGLIRSHGLAFYPAKGNVQEVVESEEMRELLEKGNFIAINRYTSKHAKRAALHWAEDGLSACEGMEMIVAGIGGLFIGVALAEKLDLPIVQAHLIPFTPTKAFPGALVPASVPRLGSWFNSFTHHATRQMMWQGSRSADQAVRQQVLDLPKASFWGPYRKDLLHSNPILYGISPAVIPKPADWDENIHVTGYWFLDSATEWEPSPELLAFLKDDPTPVYIGFGSMSNRKPEETTDLILQVLEQSGQRAVLLSGWGGLQKADLPDSVFVVDSIPHTWLFERVAAVVHHGGAGTTAAGLRAGVPSIIIPFFGDQPFWGQRVRDLGVGTDPIPRKELTAERLAQALQIAVSDSVMRQRSSELGAKIRSEDGVACAVELIQSINLT